MARTRANLEHLMDLLPESVNVEGKEMKLFILKDMGDYVVKYCEKENSLIRHTFSRHKSLMEATKSTLEKLGIDYKARVEEEVEPTYKNAKEKKADSKGGVRERSLMTRSFQGTFKL